MLDKVSPQCVPCPVLRDVLVAFPRVVPDEHFSCQALYNQYIHFKETEIPAKEQEKGQIEELYKLLEVRIILAAQRLVGGNAVLFQQDQTVLSSVYFGVEKWEHPSG